jgi:hypothetical protein
MSVDTKGRLKGYVDPEQVLNFIKQKYDNDAKIRKDITNYGKINTTDENEWIVESAFIYFKGKEDNRQLSYYHSNQIDTSNYNYYCEKGLENLVKTETTNISLGCNEEAKEIIKAIVVEFGGWYDANDCDEIDFEPIIKNSDGSIKPVFHVSMNDINKVFGGVVIIDKKL